MIWQKLPKQLDIMAEISKSQNGILFAQNLDDVDKNVTEIMHLVGRKRGQLNSYM